MTSTNLADGPKTGAELKKALELHPRTTFDFLDTLVALKFLDRAGDSAGSKYQKTPETDLFLQRPQGARRFHKRHVRHLRHMRKPAKRAARIVGSAFFPG
ncbi:MAG: hypothetical protein HRU17_16465 [Polyangiaceae bacterium]|nr:hypothetical protein [Polyangiaceae bacterium]